jgi:hypothetical protein
LSLHLVKEELVGDVNDLQKYFVWALRVGNFTDLHLQVVGLIMRLSNEDLVIERVVQVFFQKIFQGQKLLLL